MTNERICYHCAHYYAGAFQSGNRTIRIPRCWRASPTRYRIPSEIAAADCDDYSPRPTKSNAGE